MFLDNNMLTGEQTNKQSKNEKQLVTTAGQRITRH